MKKRIDRLYRWLGRLSAACDNERWESALAEADSLSAEVKVTREAIWSRAEGEESEKREAFFNGAPFFRGASYLFVAFAIILLSTVPVSVDADRRESHFAPERNVEDAMERRLTWITREEEDFINILRTGLSLNNVYTAEVEEKLPKTDRVLAVSTARGPMLRTRPVTEGNNGDGTAPKVEDILSLVRIGDKVLREGNYGIKVIR